LVFILLPATTVLLKMMGSEVSWELKSLMDWFMILQILNSIPPSYKMSLIVNSDA
jgi:hypothetical protein